jgi:hypothetical protein
MDGISDRLRRFVIAVFVGITNSSTRYGLEAEWLLWPREVIMKGPQQGS